MIGMKVHGVKNVGPNLRPESWNKAGADRFVIACGRCLLHVFSVFGNVWGRGGLAKMIGMKVHGVNMFGPGLRPQLWDRAGADRFVISCGCCVFACRPCVLAMFGAGVDWPT